MRGNAFGNVFNHGDAQDLAIQPTLGNGIVKVFDALVSKPTGEDPKMILKMGVCSTLGPILRKLGKHLPSIEGSSLLFSLKKYLFICYS
jgi:hypothetical protein